MEATLIDILGEKGKELQEKVNTRIKKEIQEGTNCLKKELSNCGRCEICTLQQPCLHSEASKIVENFEYKHPLKLNY